jgi:hypothetical protein
MLSSSKIIHGAGNARTKSSRWPSPGNCLSQRAINPTVVLSCTASARFLVSSGYLLRKLNRPLECAVMSFHQIQNVTQVQLVRLINDVFSAKKVIWIAQKSIPS